jgi:hypothetical protein
MALNWRALVVAIVTLAAGLALFKWGTGPVRGTGGDVGVIVFGVAGLAAVGLGSPRTRLLALGIAGVGAELLQALRLVGPDAPWFLPLTLGSTFDPLDLLAYAVGIVIAAGLERWWAPGAPSPG